MELLALTICPAADAAAKREREAFDYPEAPTLRQNLQDTINEIVNYAEYSGYAGWSYESVITHYRSRRHLLGRRFYELTTEPMYVKKIPHLHQFVTARRTLALQERLCGHYDHTGQHMVGRRNNWIGGTLAIPLERVAFEDLGFFIDNLSLMLA